MTKVKLRECWLQVLINSTIFATLTFLVSVLLYIPVSWAGREAVIGNFTEGEFFYRVKET